jgi:hypothetical protein
MDETPPHYPAPRSQCSRGQRLGYVSIKTPPPLHFINFSDIFILFLSWCAYILAYTCSSVHSCSHFTLWSHCVILCCFQCTVIVITCSSAFSLFLLIYPPPPPSSFCFSFVLSYILFAHILYLPILCLSIQPLSITLSFALSVHSFVQLSPHPSNSILCLPSHCFTCSLPALCSCPSFVCPFSHCQSLCHLHGLCTHLFNCHHTHQTLSCVSHPIVSHVHFLPFVCPVYVYIACYLLYFVSLPLIKILLGSKRQVLLYYYIYLHRLFLWISSLLSGFIFYHYFFCCSIPSGDPPYPLCIYVILLFIYLLYMYVLHIVLFVLYYTSYHTLCLTLLLYFIIFGK